jgi:hypothetical protein
MTTFADNTSVDHQIENVYKQAASLFDPDTELNLNNDYDLAVTELVLRLLGMDSGDKYDVAKIISEHTSTAHLLTEADFGTGVNGDLLYIGPYNVAKDFIKRHDSTTETNFNHSTRLWRVELADGNSFGVADTLEMAWRYAMAAEFGPIDDGFVPFRLK